jgi:hypothetical protein
METRAEPVTKRTGGVTMSRTTSDKAKALHAGMDLAALVGTLIDTCAMAAEGIEEVNADDEVGKGLSALRYMLKHASTLITDAMIQFERGGAK